MKGNIDVRVTGIAKILRKLNRTNPVYGRGWTAALTEAADLVRSDMSRVAPGDLGGKITTRLNARPVPLYAKVGLLPMPTRKGFRYPGALEGGPKFHYRSGPNRGRQTRGWLKVPLKALQGRIESILSRAGNQIERDWESP